MASARRSSGNGRAHDWAIKRTRKLSPPTATRRSVSEPSSSSQVRTRGGRRRLGERAIGPEEKGRTLRLRRPVLGLAPHVARRASFAAGAPHVVAHGHILLDTVVLALEVVVKPLRHVRVDVELRVLREDEVADLVRLRIATVQPRADDQLLLGNFMGDFVKGSLQDRFAPRVRDGVQLHRRIDSYAAHLSLIHI